jgi:hypothetical protein
VGVSDAGDVLTRYLAAQNAGDVDGALALIAEDAVFDVGRGRYVGDAVRGFLERLRDVHSVTTVVSLDERDGSHVAAVLDQRDDDLAPLGIDAIRLDADVDAVGGRITRFAARPTPESLARIAAARDAGRRSEGVDLAERAGTLPPPPD